VGGVLAQLEGAAPDAFAPADRELQRAAGVTNTKALLALAERWRPWRAYAAQLLRISISSG
jgi:AraC family transcriptional regulator of adaptative response / DNA-3-methyladenine glycosylase II